MLTPQEFVELWGSDDEPLVRYSASLLERLHIPDDDKRFLSAAGLPTSAAPFLDFKVPKSDELPTVAEQWCQDTTFCRYRVIGGNGSGDPIAIDEESNGNIVYLNHDNRFQRVLINNSVPQLAASLLAYRELVRASLRENGEEAILNDFPERARAECIAELRRIDPEAMSTGCMWTDDLL